MYHGLFTKHPAKMMMSTGENLSHVSCWKSSTFEHRSFKIVEVASTNFYCYLMLDTRVVKKVST